MRNTNSRGAPADLLSWPHFHRDLPARLNRTIPYFLEDELAFRAFKIIMTLQDVGAHAVNMYKCLVDETLHSL